MQSTDIPLKLPLPFGVSAGGGYIHAIPVASQIGVTDGAASLTDGFVPLNATPIGAGGVPPSIKDMNGILFEISGWTRWAAAGGPVYYDSTFATAIGGYPKGAAIQSVTTPGVIFVSTVDNNTTNPESGGVNWISLTPVPATLAELIAGVNTVKYATAATLAGLRADTAAVIAGTDVARYISPAVLASIRASNAEVRAGTDAVKYVTPAALASSNSPGIIYHPGGVIQQYGVDYRPGSLQGLYTTPFNTAFPASVDCVLCSTIKDNGDLGSGGDIWVQWRKSSTTLSTIAYTANDTGGSSSIRFDGMSWVAFGR